MKTNYENDASVQDGSLSFTENLNELYGRMDLARKLRGQ